MFKHEQMSDEPLQLDLHRPYHRLSSRLTAALNYALTVASNIINSCVPTDEDKTYMIEVTYEGPHFQYLRVKPDEEESFDEVMVEDEARASEGGATEPEDKETQTVEASQE
ncbi:MAG: hypothetical protein MI923_05220 [Phycisphaerales bacterium]|nr:hypothetical protein [Phycisphaerales bacterium]